MAFLKKHAWGIVTLLALALVIGNYFYRKPRFVQGEQALPLALTLDNGQPWHLDSLRGHYVLLHFWGSWCGPCRRENPGLVQLYREFGDSGGEPGFHILSIGIETDAQAWQAARMKDGLNLWTDHYADFQRFDGPVAKAYGVREIPTTYLLDPEGYIIGVNLDETALRKLLSKRLSVN